MKRVTLIALLLCIGMAQGQSKKNGTIYVDHPAIVTVEEMTDAFVAGDREKVASYLHDDFKAYSGNQTNKDDKGRTKEQFLNSVDFWKNNVSYLSIEPSQGAYPDALEYKDGQIWVQTWNHLKGVENNSGVKMDVPVHRLYRMKDGKIDRIISYQNENVYREIGQSRVDRKNGDIFKNHENINKVRNMMHAFEHGDMEKAYGYFDKDARFRNLETPIGEFMSMEEVKKNNQEMLKNYEIESIDVVGYPDYLEYDEGDSKIVQSWWKIRLKRKSDDKEIVMPGMWIHWFNDEGMIVNSNAYISSKWLD